MMERMAVLKIDFEGTSHLTEEFCKGQRKKMLHLLRRCLRVTQKENREKVRKEFTNTDSNEEKHFL